MSALRRRLLSLSTLAAMWLVLSATAPLWLPLALLVGLARRRRFVLARLAVMAWLYATMECLGVLGSLAISVRHRTGSSALRDAAYGLQGWWAGALFAALRRLFSLRLTIEGADALEQGPYLLAVRHTSLADTLLPAALVANRLGMRLRYVLKKELLRDPCLDLVGHQLPNHFVDRAHPSPADLEAIAKLAEDLGPRDGVVVYPEGTFFTPAKRQRALESMERRGGAQLERARALTHTLPPRPGGVMALLRAAPQLDVVLFAHEGFDRLVHMRELLDGSLVGASVRVGFRRIVAADVPRAPEAQIAWLYDAWSWVDRRARRAPDREGPVHSTPMPSPEPEHLT